MIMLLNLGATDIHVQTLLKLHSYMCNIIELLLNIKMGTCLIDNI